MAPVPIGRRLGWTADWNCEVQAGTQRITLNQSAGRLWDAMHVSAEPQGGWLDWHELIVNQPGADDPMGPMGDLFDTELVQGVFVNSAEARDRFFAGFRLVPTQLVQKHRFAGTRTLTATGQRGVSLPAAVAEVLVVSRLTSTLREAIALAGRGPLGLGVPPEHLGEDVMDFLPVLLRVGAAYLEVAGPAAAPDPAAVHHLQQTAQVGRGACGSFAVGYLAGIDPQRGIDRVLIGSSLVALPSKDAYQTWLAAHGARGWRGLRTDAKAIVRQARAVHPEREFERLSQLGLIATPVDAAGLLEFAATHRLGALLAGHTTDPTTGRRALRMEQPVLELSPQEVVVWRDVPQLPTLLEGFAAVSGAGRTDLQEYLGIVQQLVHAGAAYIDRVQPPEPA